MRNASKKKKEMELCFQGTSIQSSNEVALQFNSTFWQYEFLSSTVGLFTNEGVALFN